MRFFLYIIILSICIFCTQLFAQNPYFPTPCNDVNNKTYNSITFPIPIPTTYPPLNTSMPFDVLIGYIGMDSILNVIPWRQADSVIRTWSSINDTLHFGAKFLYAISDYNSFLFDIYKTNHPRTNPRAVIEPFIMKYAALSDNPHLDGTLLKSDFIGVLQVTDTLRLIDSAAHFSRTAIIVSSTILDTIKGRVFPSCYDYWNQFAVHNLKEKKVPVLNNINNCLQFDYRLENPLGGSFDNMTQPATDSLGNAYVKKGKKYFVFFDIGSICATNNSMHCYFRPSKMGKSGSLLTIENNNVLDPYNDFGWGTSVPLAIFTANIRARIQHIKGY